MPEIAPECYSLRHVATVVCDSMPVYTRTTSVSIVTALFFSGTAARAAVIRVPAHQPRIQGAINAAVNGDTIQVAPGTYVENLNFLGKAIRVSSDQGPQVTVIDGN